MSDPTLALNIFGALYPCRTAGCLADVSWEYRIDIMGYIVQHGPNPEHVRIVRREELRDKYSLMALTHAWLERIHPVAGSADA